MGSRECGFESRSPYICSVHLKVRIQDFHSCHSGSNPGPSTIPCCRIELLQNVDLKILYSLITGINGDIILIGQVVSLSSWRYGFDSRYPYKVHIPDRWVKLALEIWVIRNLPHITCWSCHNRVRIKKNSHRLKLKYIGRDGTELYLCAYLNAKR